MGAVAYDPNDPIEQSFLSALAYGESGSNGGLYTGNGGADLSSAPQNSVGFPIWSGVDNSHAAGLYQFQPGTFTPIAEANGLNFNNAGDQSAAAWDLAQQNDPGLYQQLQSGNYGAITSALSSTWTSLKSGKLGSLISGGIGSSLTGGAASSSGTGIAGALGVDWVAQLKNWLATSQFWQRLLFGFLGLVLVGAAFMLLARGQVQQIAKTVV